MRRVRRSPTGSRSAASRRIARDRCSPGCGSGRSRRGAARTSCPLDCGGAWPWPFPFASVGCRGMGEPFLNWDAVNGALTILNHADGFGIGARHITVSTVGILPHLAKLAQRPEQFRLALSLHAPTPALRHELMPIEKKYALPAVIAAPAPIRRPGELEDGLIGGKNDGLVQAGQLAPLPQPLCGLANLR